MKRGTIKRTVAMTDLEIRYYYPPEDTVETITVSVPRLIRPDDPGALNRHKRAIERALHVAVYGEAGGVELTILRVVIGEHHRVTYELTRQEFFQHAHIVGDKTDDGISPDHVGAGVPQESKPADSKPKAKATKKK